MQFDSEFNRYYHHNLNIPSQSQKTSLLLTPR
jgi:hypothetical protein